LLNRKVYKNVLFSMWHMTQSAPGQMSVTLGGGISYVVEKPLNPQEGYAVISVMRSGSNPTSPEQPKALYPVSLAPKDIPGSVNGFWSPKVLAEEIRMGSHVMLFTPTIDGSLPSQQIQTPTEVLYKDNMVTGVKDIKESDLERLV